MAGTCFSTCTTWMKASGDLIIGDVPRPRSGTEIGDSYQGGLGSLRIKNGGETDAIAVLLEDGTNAPKRAVYIRRGETGLMAAMPVGAYRVQFQLGTNWLRSGRFCQITSTSEFEDLLTFEERTTADGTEYSNFELTLYTVAGGNAETNALPNIPLPMPR